MTAYHDTLKSWRSQLPRPELRRFVDKFYPCRCDETWTGRGMHAPDCGWATALGVLYDAHLEGLL